MKWIQDYGFRLYNPSIGRFLSVDPLSQKFPYWTPYQFAGNTPIQAIDMDGAEIYFYIWNHWEEFDGQPRLHLAKKVDILKQTSDIALLTDLFGWKITRNIDLEYYGVDITFVYKDENWRLIPKEYHNTSLLLIDEETWQTFPTIEDIDKTTAEFRGLGEKVGTAVNIALLAKGFKDLAKGLRSFRTNKQNSPKQQKRTDYENYGSDVGEVLPNPIVVGRNRRKIGYKKYSANWKSASLENTLKRFVPNTVGRKSTDGVKTSYRNGDYLIKVDNENNYFRIYDLKRKTYLDNNGNIPRTGSRKGKEAQAYLRQETHIKDNGT